MKITEHNYEEYFLLYIDEELTGAERSVVEAFLREHPQYKTSFEVLQGAKLSIEDKTVFPGKDKLYKTEDNEISIGNYETYFLLYTDNELSHKDRETTERFVLQHPQLQCDFTMLQATKLPAENIAFQNKEILFRKEKKRRPAPLYVAGWMAAASLFALLVFSRQYVAKHTNSDVALSAGTTQRKASTVTVQPSHAIEAKSSSQVNQLQQPDTLSNKAIIAEQKKTKHPFMQEDNSVAATLPDEKIETPEIKISQPQKEVQSEPLIAEIVMQKQPETVTSKTAEVLKPLDDDPGEDSSSNASVLASDNDANVHQAVYKELNTQEDDHTLYVGSFQLNKAKVNGFLKSASRLLGNKTK